MERLTVSRKLAKILTVSRKLTKILTVSRKLTKILTVSRKLTKILTVSRKSHHLIKTLLVKLTFPVGKGLLCLYDTQNNTWLHVNMKFLFSCSTRHLTRSLRSLVSYRVKHSKINSISTRINVLFSIYH